MKFPPKLRWTLFSWMRRFRWFIDEHIVGGPEYKKPTGLFRLQIWLLKTKLHVKG